MTYLVERLAELRRHLDHLRQLRPWVPAREALARDLSVPSDVLFSLLTVCQLVIDIPGELSARRGERFEDYGQAVRNLAMDPRFRAEVVRELERLPGFRNVLIHEYVALDMDRVLETLDRLDRRIRDTDTELRLMTDRARQPRASRTGPAAFPCQSLLPVP